MAGCHWRRALLLIDVGSWLWRSSGGGLFFADVRSFAAKKGHGITIECEAQFSLSWVSSGVNDLWVPNEFWVGRISTPADTNSCVKTRLQTMSNPGTPLASKGGSTHIELGEMTTKMVIAFCSLAKRNNTTFKCSVVNTSNRIFQGTTGVLKSGGDLLPSFFSLMPYFFLIR